MTIQEQTEKHDREYKLENYRTCEMCNTPVDGGLAGIIEHIESEHGDEDLAQAVSFDWTPHEPSAIHLPNGTVHFAGTRHGPEILETTCGLSLEVADFDDVEDLRDFLSYDHADAEDYCGNCAELTKRRFVRDYLPEPLLEADR